MDRVGHPATGVALAAALAGWGWAVAGLRGGDARGLSVVLACGVAGFAAARWTARVNRRLPALAVLAAVVALLAARPDLLARGPTAGPFGYANASGAFMAQGAAAALLLATTTAGRWGRRGWLLVALGCAAVPVWLATWAAAGTAVLAFAAFAWVVRDRRWDGGRPWGVRVVWLAALPAAATVAAAVAGVTGLGPLLPRRVALWADALALFGARPLLGSGPGTFPRLAATARADADTPFAHHEALEAAAEMGVAGLLLVLALAVWWFAYLDRTGGPAALVAAAAGAGLWLHASVDYVLHFPAVVAAATAVLAAGGGGRGQRRTRPAAVPTQRRTRPAPTQRRTGPPGGAVG